MSEARSALPEASFDGLMRIEEAGLRGMVTLRADLGAAKVRKAVKAAVGVDLPGRRRTGFSGDKAALWMSPDELLLVMPHGEAPAAVAGLARALAGVHHLAVAVSDARAVFRLTGDLDTIREVLAKLTPADLGPGVFEEGEVLRTRLAQVPAAFWIEEGGVTLVCFRSVARYVFDLMSNAAAPGGDVRYWT